MLYTDWYICSMKFSPRNEDTRQFIIENTAAIFNQKGYSGTSLTDLTEATKLTKGSIYGNFENKEAVAAAVFEYNSKQRVEAMNTAVNAAITYREKLLVYATFFSANNGKLFPKGGCPFLNTGIEADDTNEMMRRKVADALLAWKKRITDLIIQGIEAGEFKEDADANSIAISLIALAEGGIFMSSVTRNHIYARAVATTASTIIENICLT